MNRLCESYSQRASPTPSSWEPFFLLRTASLERLYPIINAPEPVFAFILKLLLPIPAPCCVWVGMRCKMAPSLLPSSATSLSIFFFFFCCRMLGWCRRAGKRASSTMSSASPRSQLRGREMLPGRSQGCGVSAPSLRTAQVGSRVGKKKHKQNISPFSLKIFPSGASFHPYLPGSQTALLFFFPRSSSSAREEGKSRLRHARSSHLAKMVAYLEPLTHFCLLFLPPAR